MAECTVYLSETYRLETPFLAVGPKLSDGDTRAFDVLSGHGAAADRASRLWSYVRGASSAKSFVNRAGTWALVDKPTDADVAAGYDIIWGGRTGDVTGQTLVDMFGDGVLDAAAVCAADLVGTEVPLLDSDGNQLRSSSGEVMVGRTAAGSTQTLVDA